MEQTELIPAEIVPFRRYDYTDNYFDQGKQVLEGPVLPFEKTRVGQEDVETTDHLYVRLEHSPVFRREQGRG